VSAWGWVARRTHMPTAAAHPTPRCPFEVNDQSHYMCDELEVEAEVEGEVDRGQGARERSGVWCDRGCCRSLSVSMWHRLHPRRLRWRVGGAAAVHDKGRERHPRCTVAMAWSASQSRSGGTVPTPVTPARAPGIPTTTAAAVGGLSVTARAITNPTTASRWAPARVACPASPLSQSGTASTAPGIVSGAETDGIGHGEGGTTGCGTWVAAVEVGRAKRGGRRRW